jgi:putative FmdB family regulatory protein
MPTYEYECTTCGYQFEREQKITDEPIKDCPSCGNSVKRMISCGNFVLKGSGWYITDYARKNNKTSEKTNSCGDSAACGGCEAAKS